MSIMVIGLTGPTGSGKTTVCEAAKGLGIAVINADMVSREVVLPGQPALAALTGYFGDSILRSDGFLDRAELARLAFSDEAKTKALDKIIFPFIVDRVNQQISKIEDDGKTAVLLDAPTLYESDADKICNKVIAVLCPLNIRRKRIIERDNLSEEDADIRLKAQKSDNFYIERTNYIIINDGSVEQLFSKSTELLSNIFLK
ncbi:MAG: dephospho-CoA kinase [Oscillospiraceae bacterium]|nr:dephospho-CoA kinase [Oscillospiraceae bacterium]